MKYFSRQKASVNMLVVCMVAAWSGAGLSALAITAKRQNIGSTAKSIKALEISIANIDRHQAEISTQIASEQSFDVLIHRNESFRLGLSPIREQQIVRVNVQPELRLALKRNAELLTDVPATAPRSTNANADRNTALPRVIIGMTH